MKAIKVTEKLKRENPSFFRNASVDTIFRANVPSSFKRGSDIVFGYNNRLDLQELDGWKEIVEPTIDPATQFKGGLIDNPNDPNTFTYEVINYTPEQIQANEEAKIPQQISTLNFKLGLLINHQITNTKVDQIIESIPDIIQIEMLKLLWYESNTINRTDENLLAFAPALGLTENDLKVICRDFANFR